MLLFGPGGGFSTTADPHFEPLFERLALVLALQDPAPEGVRGVVQQRDHGHVTEDPGRGPRGVHHTSASPLMRMGVWVHVSGVGVGARRGETIAARQRTPLVSRSSSRAAGTAWRGRGACRPKADGDRRSLHNFK